MNNNYPVVHHLYHSGVAVEFENKMLIFDYSNNNVSGNQKRKISSGVITTEDLLPKDNIFVFVSHSHGDHFNSHIFKWEEELNNDIYYILSNDITTKKEKENFIFVDKYEQNKIKDIEIKTLGSTDRGVSFLVSIAGINIFHAGDLNWWHWNNNSEAKQKQEEKDYKKEIQKLENINKEINIAFIPVDPRLEEYFYLAGEYFADKINPDYLIPIHFGSQFDITQKFADKIKHLETDAVIIEKRGQRIEIEI